MDDLQWFYRGAVGDQVAASDHALLQLESGAPSAEETVRQLAYTLKGSGSGYGLPEVSYRLEREGYEVEHHANGDSALTKADDHHFGPVVLDAQMPSANGFDVLQRIRSNPDSTTPRSPCSPPG